MSQNDIYYYFIRQYLKLDEESININQICCSLYTNNETQKKVREQIKTIDPENYEMSYLLSQHKQKDEETTKRIQELCNIFAYYIITTKKSEKEILTEFTSNPIGLKSVLKTKKGLKQEQILSVITKYYQQSAIITRNAVDYGEKYLRAITTRYFQYCDFCKKINFLTISQYDFATNYDKYFSNDILFSSDNPFDIFREKRFSDFMKYAKVSRLLYYGPNYNEIKWFADDGLYYWEHIVFPLKFNKNEKTGWNNFGEDTD